MVVIAPERIRIRVESRSSLEYKGNLRHQTVTLLMYRAMPLNNNLKVSQKN